MKRMIVFVILGLFSGDAYGDTLLNRANAIVSGHKKCVREIGRPFPQYAEAVFSDARLSFVEAIFTKKSAKTKDELTAEYRKNVLSPESIDMGISISTGFRKHLVALQAKYGVSAYDIVAIWRAESNFSTYFGSAPVVNTLYTMCVMVPDKREFAIRELRQFLAVAQKNGWDPFSIIGSSAGAFGATQFIPTSYAAYAVDGDGDGKIDLFNILDATASTANYLARHRYASDRRASILRYNPWGTYADVVMEYADRTRMNYVKKSRGAAPLS